METDEGIDAPNPCSWCSKKGHNSPCRVWKEKEDLACAYCKRHGKSGCKARDKGKGKAATVEEEEEEVDENELTASQQRVAVLEDEVTLQGGRIAELGGRITELEAEVASLKSINETARLSWEAMQETVASLWRKVNPEQE